MGAEFLGVDRVDVGGGRHRRAVPYPSAGPRVSYDWVIKDGFLDNIRVLCYDRNMPLGSNG